VAVQQVGDSVGYHECYALAFAALESKLPCGGSSLLRMPFPQWGDVPTWGLLVGAAFTVVFAGRIRGEIPVGLMLSQVRGPLVDICKTVGLAYVGSNPTPVAAIGGAGAEQHQAVTFAVWLMAGPIRQPDARGWDVAGALVFVAAQTRSHAHGRAPGL
jgi:hypothetical protein